MARARRQSNNRGGGQAATRTARVGELIRRVVAEGLDRFEDDRFDMVSITSVDVDRDLHRAVVWFTSLADDDDDPEILEAFGEYRGKLRHEVSVQTRLRRAPELDFRPDTTLRAAARIEELLRVDREPHGEPHGEADRGEEA